MILQSGYECYLTQVDDVPASERVFLTQVNIVDANDFAAWKEVTKTFMDQFLAGSAFIDVDNIDYASLKRVDVLLDDIRSNINEAPLTPEQAIEMQEYFPEWDHLVKEKPATKVQVGFRLQHKGVLYEVIQEHSLQSNWEPGVGTESLYQVVQVTHAGTEEDPIPWQHNMLLESGKFYTDKGVLYECIRDSGIGMMFDLKDLVSGGYVKEVLTDKI